MPKILIVDDELTTRMELEEMLTFLGYEVVGEAETGRQAVDMALKLKPDVILMDIVMPGEIDGISAAEEIKAQSDAVIVFISGYSDDEYIERAKKVEPFGYVMKPFDEKEIRGFVEIALYKKDMENRMKASHAQLSALFENTDDFIMIADEKGIPQSFNAAYKRIIKETLGLDMKPGIQPHTFLNDPKAVQYWDELHQRVLSGEKFKAEFTQELLSGETRHFEFSFCPIIQSGEVKGFVEVTRDVTERQRTMEEMTESREKYRHLINHAPAGVFEVDFGKQRFVQVNDVMCEYTGYTREEFFSMSPFDILAEESKPVFGERFKKVIAGERVPASVEFKIRAKSGTTFWVLLTSNFIYEDSKIKGAHVVVHDITERKRAEAAQIAYQDRLKAIGRIGALANSSLETKVVLDSILKNTVQTLNADAGMMFLHDTEIGCLVWAAAFGLSETFVNDYRHAPIHPGEGLTGRIFQTGSSIFVSEESSQDPRIVRDVVKREGLNSFIGVPLYDEGRIIGVMNILTRAPKTLTDGDLDLCEAIAAQVNLSIRNALLFDEKVKSEKALRENEKHLQTLIENI